MTVKTMTDTTRYADAVRAALADVPEPDREELLDDLEQHLAEVAADAGGPLEERLGSPLEYAAELRASAGLGDASEPSRPSAAATRLATRVRAVRAHPRVRAVTSFLRELRPAWWVARGAVIVAVYGVISYGVALGFPFPRFIGSRFLGLGVMAAAAAGSVWVARRDSALMRTLNVALSLAGVVAAMYYVSVLNTATARDPLAHPTASESYGESMMAQDMNVLYRWDGRQINNIYPYDASGRLLENVRLYDQRGKPLDITRDQTRFGRRIVTSYPLDAEGRPVTNAFPQRQAIGGSSSGAATPPAVVVPPMEQASPAAKASSAESEGGNRKRTRADK